MMLRLSLLLLALAAAGCAAPRPDGPPRPRPALLTEGDLGAVQAAIREVEGGPVAFGRPDGTDAPFLIVLPAPAGPQEGRNLGTPTVYDIVIGPDGCYLDRRSDDLTVSLKTVRCKPFGDDEEPRRNRRQ